MLRVTAGEPIDNLLPGPEGGVLFGGRPAADVAFRGAPASEHRLRSDRAVLSHRVAVQPETTYLFSTRLRLPESAPAGRVEVWLVPHDSRAGRDRRYKAAPYPSFRLVPGQWTLVCSTLATPPETDTLIIYLVHRGLDGHPIHLADGKLAAIAGAPKPQPPGAL